MDKKKSLKILKNLENKIDNLSPEEKSQIVSDAKEFFAEGEKQEGCCCGFGQQSDYGK